MVTKKRRSAKAPTPESEALVRRLAVAGLSQEVISDVLEINRETLVKHYGAILKKAKAQVIAEIADGVVTRAKLGDNACAFFYLKTQAGWREKERPDEDADKKPESVRLIVLEKPTR